MLLNENCELKEENITEELLERELRGRQKTEAIERMKKLKIMPQSIKEFEENGIIYLSGRESVLYQLNEEEQKMVDELEQNRNALVYHVIRSKTNFGLMYSLLYVSKYDEEWKMDKKDIEGGQAIAYVINMDIPGGAEIGSIGIQPLAGRVIRTW